MATTTPEAPPARDPKTRRVWPALVLVVLGVACYLSINLFALDPENMPMMALFMTYMWGPILCALLLIGWWLVRGPALLRTRLLVVGAGVVLGVVAWFVADPSIRSSLAMQGYPGVVGAAALGLLVPARLPRLRAVAALVLGLAALLPWDLMRLNGMTGKYGMDLAPRWKQTAEQAAEVYVTKGGPSAGESSGQAPAEAGPGDWPGFRGPRRDGVAPSGVGDWTAAPPKEAWRHPVGPAWSSVCVVGDRLFTQEQIGPQELVVCYRVADGQQLWRHDEAERHADEQSGPGPRATPTFHDGKVYSLGARGVLTCLEAGDGKPVWREDLKKATGDKLPMWGVSSSPLVVGDKVIVHPGVKEGPRLMAFDAKTGSPLWTTPPGGDSYSSPQLAELAGVPQVLIFTTAGLSSHDPATGEQLWKYDDWKFDDFSQTMTQPLVLPGDKVVLGGGRIGLGSRCLQVAHGADGWTVSEVWKTKFSPAFNDVVHRDGFLYGLESGRLVCLDAATGKQRWKDGSYGAGQLLLAGDKLVVQAETGELALVAATPDGFHEIATREALKDKTWNHPVVANGRLFVRNGGELVCFDLSGATGPR